MNILNVYITILVLCASALCAQDTLISTLAQTKFDQAPTSIEEKPIVVVIPSYNNSEWYESNLSSVLAQHYSNFRIIYVDDCSTDNTYDLVEKFMREKNAQDKVTLIHNSMRKGALANTYASIHMCKNNEIVVMLDGDDWLAHDHVLEKINAVYADPNIWLTYGQFKAFPDNRIGECKQINKKVVKHNIYREWDWCALHVRSFYAGLFKQIKLQDLFFEGTFFDVSGDMAMMFPMLEMSGGRFKFISEVLYIYNCQTPFNDHKKKAMKQMHCDKVIRSRKKYKSLKELPLVDKENAHEVSVLIFSDNRPIQLYAVLESIEQYINCANEIYVLFQVQDEKAYQVYQAVKRKFSKVHFISCDGTTYQLETMKVLEHCLNPFILCMHDTICFKNSVDIPSCIMELEKTGCYAFYLSLGKNITKNPNLNRTLHLPPFVMLSNNICAWQFNAAEYDWRTPNTLNAAIYKKEDIIDKLNDLNFDSMETLEKMWDKCLFDFSKVGLCFDESKTNYLPSDNNMHSEL